MTEPPKQRPKDPAYWGEVHIRADKAPPIQLPGRRFIEEKPRRFMFPKLRKERP